MNVEPVSLTEKAAKEVLKIKAQKQINESYALRLDVKGNASGCGGFGFKLGFDQSQVTDIEYFNNDVKIVVDKKRVLFLMNLEVDYLDQGEEKGFFFNKKDNILTHN